MSTERNIALIFNEWAKRYAESPEYFGTVLDANGDVVEEYGENSASVLVAIANDLGIKVHVD